MVDFGNAGAQVCVIGPCRFDTGIGAVSHAALELFSRHAPCTVVATDDAAGAHPVQLPSGRTIPHCTDPGAASLFFFADVLFKGAHDSTLTRLPDHGVHVADVCIDSDDLPVEWVWRLNHHFDGSYVPSARQRDVLVASGVRTPVGVLPVALPIEPLLARDVVDVGDVVRFGTISAFHPRKELVRLVLAFQRAFAGRSDVELTIHSNVSVGSTYDEVVRAAGRVTTPRVEVSLQSLSAGDRDALLESFDVFVNCSRGESYSIGCREALALGKALVLSDIGAHDDLRGVPGVFHVPPDHAVPARYPEIDHRVFGRQQVASVEAIAVALDAACASVRDPRHRETVAARRRRAADFSFTRLSVEYASVIDPDAASTRLGAGGRRSEDVWHPPEVLTTVRRRTPRRAGARGRLVVPCHDSGYFSVFNSFVSHLVWALQDDRCHEVLPDWHQSGLTERLGTEARASFCYGKPSDLNIWTKVYEPFAEVPVEELDDPHALYHDATTVDADYNEHREPLLTYTNAFDLYRSPWFRRFRRQYQEAHERFVRPLPEVRRPVDELLCARVGDRFLLAAHVRHPSHVVEQPERRMACNHDYFVQVRRALEDHGVPIDSDEWRLFLGTDQHHVVRAFEERFGDHVVTFSDVERTTQDDGEHLRAVAEGTPTAQGRQVHQLVAAQHAAWSVDMAREVVRDAVAMAEASVLLHVVSNVATAVSYMNPEIEMRYVEPAAQHPA